MTQKIKGQLPGKLSELVTLALDDAEKLNRDIYKPASSAWHEPGRYTLNKECFVCLSGVVIAGRLKGDIEQILGPDCFDEKTSEKLLALNSFREGDFEAALDYTGQGDSMGKHDMKVATMLEENAGCRRMVQWSMFRSWEEFDNFAVLAREVVELLAREGF